MQAVDYDAAQFEQGSEMPKGPDVSEIVEQIKARLKQIEDQFGQHQRLADELERVRDVAMDLERAFVSRINGGQPPAAKPTARGKRPTADHAPDSAGPRAARTEQGQDPRRTEGPRADDRLRDRRR